MGDRSWCLGVQQCVCLGGEGRRLGGLVFRREGVQLISINCVCIHVHVCGMCRFWPYL